MVSKLDPERSSVTVPSAGALYSHQTEFMPSFGMPPSAHEAPSSP